VCNYIADTKINFSLTSNTVLIKIYKHNNLIKLSFYEINLHTDPVQDYFTLFFNMMRMVCLFSADYTMNRNCTPKVNVKDLLVNKHFYRMCLFHSRHFSIRLLFSIIANLYIRTAGNFK